LNICFFASRVALSMAKVVSIALPKPTPTRPFRSPETTATEKVKRRPPAATRVTRRISIIFVSNSGLTRSLPSRLPPRRDLESRLFFMRGGRASNAPGATAVDPVGDSAESCLASCLAAVARAIGAVTAVAPAVAAAIGAGLPIADASGTMIIDLGAGSSDVVVISLGGITDIETIRSGGDDIDTNIVKKVKETYNVEIGIHEAEKAKIKVGMVHSKAKMEPISTQAIGKSLETNKPQKIEIDSIMIADAAEPIIIKLIEALSLILKKISPELIAGVYNKTIIVGGTSQLKGLKERIYEEVGIPVEISDDPMTVVAKGAAIVAAEPRALEPEVRLKAMK